MLFGIVAVTDDGNGLDRALQFGGGMPVGVCAVRPEMVVSVGMRDCMRVDVAARNA